MITRAGRNCLQRPELVRVQAADCQTVRAATQAQPYPAGIVTRHLLDHSGPHHGGAVDLPELVRVLTGDHEYLVRTPLRELLPQLDPDEFWQVHRATVVRARMIEQVTRDDAGKVWLRLRGCADRLAVSRLYAHQFRAL